MIRLSTLLATTLTSALGLTAPIAASADPMPQPNFHLGEENPVAIYTQPNKGHPAPVFLICTGMGTYSVDLIDESGVFETLFPTSCLYASNHKISARISPRSKEEVAETDEAIRRANAWIDERIADLESKSEVTEAEAKLLKSLKERHVNVNNPHNRKPELPFVTATLVR